MCRNLCLPWFVVLSLPMHMCLSHPIHPFLMGAAGGMFLFAKTFPSALGSSLAPCCRLCPGPLQEQPLPLSLSGMMFMESHTQPLSCIFHGAALWGRRRLIIKQHRAEIAAAPSCDYPAVPAAAPASCHPLVPRHRLDCLVLCLWDHNVPEHR